VRDVLAWRLGRRPAVRMRPMRLTTVLFAGYGTRREVPQRAAEQREPETARTVGS